jgi:DNA-binding transcriptional MocR family regulator
MLILHPEQPTPLVSQIVEGLRGLIGAQKLKADSKLPSIRAFAATHGVSVFTVVEAYDRLVAQGYLVSRPHSGFFVRKRAAAGPLQPMSASPQGFDSAWYLRRIFEHRHLAVKAGCGWLPGDWLFEDGLRRGLRALAADDADLGGYGDPKGYPPLRQAICEALAEQQLTVPATRWTWRCAGWCAPATRCWWTTPATPTCCFRCVSRGPGSWGCRGRRRATT